MIRFISYLITSFLIVSCASEEKEISSLNEKEANAEIQKLNNEFKEVLDNAEQELALFTDTTKQLKFSCFEDYAQITNRQLLIKTFGNEYLKHDTTWYEEGTVMMLRSVLKNPINNNVINYLWEIDYPDSLAFIESNLYQYDKNYEMVSMQNIKTKDGLELGMQLSDIVKWNNNEDFSFYGFDWDYGGVVIKNKGTKLFDSKIELTLSLNNEVFPTNQYDSLFGDIELNTAMQLTHKANIVIGSMVYRPESLAMKMKNAFNQFKTAVLNNNCDKLTEVIDFPVKGDLGFSQLRENTNKTNAADTEDGITKALFNTNCNLLNTTEKEVLKQFYFENPETENAVLFEGCNYKSTLNIAADLGSFSWSVGCVELINEPIGEFSTIYNFLLIDGVYKLKNIWGAG